MRENDQDGTGIQTRYEREKEREKERERERQREREREKKKKKKLARERERRQKNYEMKVLIGRDEKGLTGTRRDWQGREGTGRGGRGGRGSRGDRGQVRYYSRQGLEKTKDKGKNPKIKVAGYEIGYRELKRNGNTLPEIKKKLYI